MLTNDTVNLLTLCPALSLACQSCGYHANGFQLLVLQLQLCCRLRDYGFRIIFTATGPIVHNDPARPPSLLALTDIAVSPSKSTGEAAAFFPRV
jgi:hypothetical protein